MAHYAAHTFGSPGPARCRRPVGSRRVGACLVAVALVACDASVDAPEPATAPRAEFVGNAACASCHAAEHAAWTGSHHALAMQPAGAETVAGDFDGTTFEHGGVTTTFSRSDDGGYVVSTAGPDGAPADYRVAYAFGVDPLQQYLLEMPDGRLQAFTIAWDTRPAAQGGQRWFDLQAGERIEPADPLHWTGVLQSWNSSCAECHSTGVEKRYAPDADTYATTFASVEVGCEACHGPGSNHAAAPAEHGLALARAARAWNFADDAAIAHRVPATHADTEIETCAACHSRRGQLTDDAEAGTALLDGFRPALLTDPLYHADGQIRDEVFVYGSFVQSPMHATGVTCSDCHDPHSAALRADGNAVCSGCHEPSVYATRAHHRHPAGTAGAQCVSCHMPAETYMVVDPRRDHSFRVPRPDLSVTLGTPNACNDCHEQPAAWAAERVAEWYPDGRTGRFHYAQALHAGRNWTAQRGALLRRVAADATQPAIARATALRLLAEQIDSAAIEAIRAALDGAEPLVQLTALDALGSVPVDLRADLGQRFLTAPLLALRLAAAEALMPARDALSTRRAADLDTAVAELRASQQLNLDRAEALLGRASLEVALGRPELAEAALRTAIARRPAYAASYVNLADLYRGLGREADAEQVLRDGLTVAPDDAALHHALGLALVRASEAGDALPLLERAAELAPGEPRYAYVHGVALNSLAGTRPALDALARTHERFPAHAPTLVALATMHRDAGDTAEALRYARLLLEQSPDNAAGNALVAELE